MIADALVSLFSRRSLENPSVSLSDPEAWEEMEAGWDEAMGGGGRTAAGISMGSRKALQYAPVWRGVSLLSGDVAKVPLKVFDVTADGEKSEQREHPAWRVLRRPNSQTTRFVFWRTFMLHAIFGNGIAYIKRDGGGRPLELWPMDSRRVDIDRVNGQIKYRYQFSDGREENYGAVDVLHVPTLTWDGVAGMQLIRYAKQSFAYGLAMERFGAAFFGNNAEPGVIIKYPGKLTDDALQRMSRSWKASHQGVDHAHRPAILEQGADAVTMASKARDAQLNESMLFSILLASAWLGMPPHKLGHPARTSYNSLEAENQDYLDSSLDPWLVTIEDELRVKLLTEEEQDSESATIEYNRNALVRADIGARFGAYQIAAAGSPFMTQNEIRRRENLPPLDGGDELKGAAAIVGGAAPMPKPNDEPPELEPEPEEDDDDEESERTKARVAMGRVLLDALERASRRIANQAKRAAGRPREFLSWIEHPMMAANILAVNEIIGEPAERHSEMCGYFDPKGVRMMMADALAWKWHDWLLERSGECKATELEACIESRALDFAPQAAAAVFSEFQGANHDT